MSTRSGKRIHGSIHESAVDDVPEIKSERKTRAKRLKEMCNEIASEKKRKHYVRYPSEEDLTAADNTEKLLRSSRKSQRNALKEHNIVATDSEASNEDRTARHTRRTRKTEAADNTENAEPCKEVQTKIKGKNNKKKKILSDENILEPVLQTFKKKSNKKKKRKSGSLIVEDIPQKNDDKNDLSNMSIDSFHSAAGSPVKDCNEHIENNVRVLDVPSKSTRSHNKVLEIVETIHQMEDMPSKSTRSKIHSVKNISLDVELKTKKKKDVKRKRNLTNENACNNSLTTTTNDEDVSNSSKVDIIVPIFPTTDSNETKDKHTDSFNNSAGFNNLLKNSNKKRRSINNSMNDKNDLLPLEIEIVKTPDKLLKLDTTKELSSTKKNSTYDKQNVSEKNLNATFNEENLNNSNQNDQSQGILTKIKRNSLKKKKKSTFDRINVSETSNLNATFDKEISNEYVNQFNQPENDLNNVKGSNEKKTNSACDKTNGDLATNLYETEVTNVPNNYSKHAQNDSSVIINSKNSNRKKKHLSYDKINFSETSLNVTIDEEMPENPIKELEESQNVITNGIMNSDKKKRKSSIRKSIFNNIDASIINLDATFEKNDSYLTEQNVQSNTQEKELRKSRRLSKFSLDQNVSSNLNATYDKSTLTESQPNSRKNSTFDKTDKINTTFEMVKSTKLDATFDKSENNDKTRRGSSLISSDNTGTVSSETSKDMSRISITSDESMADNIVNVTPVLIESSVDESQINISSFEPNKSIKENAETKNTPLPSKLQKEFKDIRDVTLEEKIAKTSSKNVEKVTGRKEGTYTEIKYSTPLKSKEKVPEIKTSKTPLKREGTYTEIKYSTPPKSKEKVTEIKTSKTPLKREGTYTEIKYFTPPKSKETLTENKKGSTTPKGKETFTETKSPHTPIREGTYTELKITPLNREGTYTDLNPTTTPSKKDIINTEFKTPLKNKIEEKCNATPPLKREGTFTKDSDVPESPKVQTNVNKTPTRRKSLPTPFPVSKSASKEEDRVEKSILNVTRSIEKSRRRSSIADLLPRATKVMFCSPIDTPIVVGQMKGKLIKSNLKGSDKSFVFDDSVLEVTRPPRKRSYTQSEAEAVSSKRKRLTADQQRSVERLSRPRSTSASGKFQDPGTPSKTASTACKSKTEVTPSKSKPESRVLRTKLPNFAALHQKQFAKMESLDECQERKAKRARQLLTPTGSVNIIERISPSSSQEKETQPLSTTEPQPQAKRDSPKKSIIPLENQGYTRFGFKLDMDVNPFSFPAKTETKPKTNRESKIKPLKRQATLPSLAGATILRKEIAKQTVLREKSFTEKRDMKRVENRTVIKGVRTNRRFELQMKMRNVK